MDLKEMSFEDLN